MRTAIANGIVEILFRLDNEINIKSSTDFRSEDYMLVSSPWHMREFDTVWDVYMAFAQEPQDYDAPRRMRRFDILNFVLKGKPQIIKTAVILDLRHDDHLINPREKLYKTKMDDSLCMTLIPKPFHCFSKRR
jgi:hypothetical protein